MTSVRERLLSIVAVTTIIGAWVLTSGGPSAVTNHVVEQKSARTREVISGISTSEDDATVTQRALVVPAADHDISPAVRTLPRPHARTHPVLQLEFEGVTPPATGDIPEDPVVQSNPGGLAPTQLMPTPATNFAGVGNVQGYAPPDTNGDVGPNHYVQTVNVAMRIWNKSGTPVTAVADVNALWDGFGGLCETTNEGDPIVLYDPIADRWLISQFAFSGNGSSAPFYECVAISTSPNPAGTYYRYSFLSPSNRFPDYPKFGVWPDGYYMSVNEFSEAGGYVGVGAWAMDRSRMLTGQSATMQYFHLGTNYGNFLPADLDGATLPPAGAANPFISFDDWSSSPRLKVMNFRVNWATPGSTTFTAAPDIITAAFDSNLCGGSNCMPQPGTSNKVDALADRLMWRLAYRNFGSHQAMVVSHTVDTNGADRAGVRWYELRSTSGTWSILQQGTYSPDATNRFMPSVAMDGDGNIAVGYSASSTSVYPGLRYAGRLASDPAGQLSQGESVLVAGGGSQTGGGGRWGDYSSMSVDPTDDCTFWFTSEYYTSTSSQGWATRIGSFKFPSCTGSGGGGGGGGGGGSTSSLSIGNTTVTEGNTGSTNAVFPVTLSHAQTSQTVTVNYNTINGTATAGSDYTSTSGTLTFAPNETSQTISVSVTGDVTVEPDETIAVNLSNPSANATLGTSQGVATILNDDTGGGGGGGGTCTITGTNGNDVLHGTSGNDVICGLGGFDRLFGEGGNDTLDGGTGYDRADFRYATGGVSLDMGTGTAVGSGDSGTDTLISVSDVIGSKYNDTLVGDAGSNWFFSGPGDDVLSGLDGDDKLRGESGNDNLTGGNGWDRCVQGTGSGIITSCER